jgi:hypothetical protein
MGAAYGVEQMRGHRSIRRMTWALRVGGASIRAFGACWQVCLPPRSGHESGTVGGAARSRVPGRPGGFYAERILDLDRIDVQEISEALADQTTMTTAG